MIGSLRQDARLNNPPGITFGRAALARRAVFLLVASLICVYYLWVVRCTGNRFYWHNDLPGYYNYLGRAFAAGHLHLPVEPSRELLALSNPWDPSQNDPYRMHDMVLFNERYYLYHGAGPAVLLFAPWRWISGHDLPENFAIFAFSFGGFLFSCGTLFRLLDVSETQTHPALLTLALLGLGLSQAVPFLLNRIWVYEIAIAGGYCCLMGGFYFLSGTLKRFSRLSLAASGLFFGLCFACRPHPGLAGGIAALVLLVYLLRCVTLREAFSKLMSFALPFLFCLSAVAAYNFARFGNPFEFGVRYLLAGDTHQQNIALNWANFVPGLYYFVLCPPDFSAVFPWIRPALKLPWGLPEYPLMHGYFLEPTIGALWTCPFLLPGATISLLWWRRTRRISPVLAAGTLAGAAILLFVAGTGFTTQRYQVDFTPLFVLLALASSLVIISRASRLSRIALTAALTMLVIFSIIANLALGITGPYDEMLASRPASYVKIANSFTSFEHLRLRLNPPVELTVRAHFIPRQEGLRESLITLGNEICGYTLEAEHKGGRVLLHSNAESVSTYDIEHPYGELIYIRVVYRPAEQTVELSVNGKHAAQHHVRALVTAPAQVRLGKPRSPGIPGANAFGGRIELIALSLR